MDTALALVAMFSVVIAVRAFAARIGISAPLILVLGGAAVSFLPFVPYYKLTPELILVGLLPPLLYAAAIRTSLVDFGQNRRPILLLSVGLVVFTAFGVALFMWAVLPISFAPALALGAVLAPPDAVAATSIARRIGLPRRVVTILEGESLVNDATAIVTLRTAIVSIAGTVSLWQVGGSFLVSALGGVVVGVLVAVVVGRIRVRINDDLTDVAVSLLTPWIAYLPAEQLHVHGVSGHGSGIIAVVVAGLILGHKSPAIQSASSRVFERTNWSTISFVLENSVFLLIGLQVKVILSDVMDSELSMGRIVAAAVLSLAAVVLLRMIWVFPAIYLPRLIPRIRAADPPPRWQHTAIVSWAGMRGIVTLAGVFLIPEGTKYREVFVAIAMFVTAGTLLLQGLTLPWLVKFLDVRGPDRHEDFLQEATIFQAVTNTGLEYLDGHLAENLPDIVIQRLRTRSLDRVNAVWERLGGAQTPSTQYSRARTAILAREREEVLRIRDRGVVDQTVLKRVLDALDVEETLLDRLYEDETTANRATVLRPEAAGGCEHLLESSDIPKPHTPQGCQECLRDGTEWVHLRLCLECGHVGCCDSTEYQHASLHFEETGHPVMRSFEAGEEWRWCFIDEVVG